MILLPSSPSPHPERFLMDSFSLLEQELHAKYEGAPHRQTLVALALADIRSALSSLAHLGHRFDLVESEAKPPAEFPKMFYSKDGKRQLVLHSPEAAAGLSDDWSDKQPQEDPEDPMEVSDANGGPDEAEAQGLAPIPMLSLDAQGIPVIVQDGKETLVPPLVPPPAPPPLLDP